MTQICEISKKKNLKLSDFYDKVSIGNQEYRMIFIIFIIFFLLFISNMKPNLAKLFSGMINRHFDNITKPLKETVLSEGCIPKLRGLG
jgi:hypothetical protein